MTSATAAYRKDLAANGLPFSDRDGEWITVASLVETAAAGVPDVELCAWNAAVDTATRALGTTELDRLANREWGAPWSAFDPLTLISVAMHETGARDLSTVVLDGILRVRADERDLAYGRALAQRARVAYLAGEQEVAEDFYRQVDAIGRRLNLVELRARAANGFAGLAQLRGNHPELLEVATRGLALAEQTGIPRLRWNARYAIMMSTALFRRFDEALQHGWEMFSLVKGEALGEALALHSLGQLLLDMGEVDAAQSAFEAVVSRPLPSHVLLSSLGSLANTTAMSAAHRPKLDWAVAEVEAFRNAATSPWAYAAALLDCVIALRDAGQAPRARALLDEALAIAKVHGFHSLRYRADSIELDALTSLPERAELGGQATEIVRSVQRLAPRRLPRHVRMATAQG